MYLAVHAQQDPTAIFAEPFANINRPIKLHSSHLRSRLYLERRLKLTAVQACTMSVTNFPSRAHRALPRSFPISLALLQRFCVLLRITSSGSGARLRRRCSAREMACSEL